MAIDILIGRKNAKNQRKIHQKRKINIKSEKSAIVYGDVYESRALAPISASW